MARVLIVGGGAAGYFAALTAAEVNPALEIVIAEAQHRPLSKVRISGGGRCNVTQGCFEPQVLCQKYPRGGKELRGPFTRFQPRDTMQWFAKHGVELQIESDGRVFPKTNSSETVIHCFEKVRVALEVVLWTRCRVRSIARLDNGFEVSLSIGGLERREHFTAVVLACGGNSQSFGLAEQLGHRIIPPVPSLFTFEVQDPLLHELAGISCEHVSAELRFKESGPYRSQGALLITHWGFSGPAIISLSSWAARALFEHSYQAELILNFLGKTSLEQARHALSEARQQQAKQRLASNCPFELPQRLWQYIVQAAGVQPGLRYAELNNATLNVLASQATESRHLVSGKGVFKEEFVTCGGVSLTEVDFRSMQSKLVQQLYIAGEVLDIDGLTGGYNFQSAWTTGFIAGRSLAEQLR